MPRKLKHKIHGMGGLYVLHREIGFFLAFRRSAEIEVEPLLLNPPGYYLTEQPRSVMEEHRWE